MGTKNVMLFLWHDVRKTWRFALGPKNVHQPWALAPFLSQTLRMRSNSPHGVRLSAHRLEEHLADGRRPKSGHAASRARNVPPARGAPTHGGVLNA
jgi:hypothetical protein